MNDTNKTTSGGATALQEDVQQKGAIAPLEEEGKHPGKGGDRPALGRSQKKGQLLHFEQMVAAAFAANKDVELLYFTSNGWAFFTEDKAQEAAAGLPDKRVKKILNPSQAAEGNGLK